MKKIYNKNRHECGKRYGFKNDFIKIKCYKILRGKAE